MCALLLRAHSACPWSCCAVHWSNLHKVSGAATNRTMEHFYKSQVCAEPCSSLQASAYHSLPAALFGWFAAALPDLRQAHQPQQRLLRVVQKSERTLVRFTRACLLRCSVLVISLTRLAFCGCRLWFACVQRPSELALSVLNEASSLQRDYSQLLRLCAHCTGFSPSYHPPHAAAPLPESKEGKEHKGRSAVLGPVPAAAMSVRAIGPSPGFPPAHTQGHQGRPVNVLRSIEADCDSLDCPVFFARHKLLDRMTVVDRQVDLLGAVVLR